VLGGVVVFVVAYDTTLFDPDLRIDRDLLACELLDEAAREHLALEEALETLDSGRAHGSPSTATDRSSSARRAPRPSRSTAPTFATARSRIARSTSAASRTPNGCARCAAAPASTSSVIAARDTGGVKVIHRAV
jgi:hypothetical protein